MRSQYGHGFLSIFFGGKYDLIQLHRQIMHQNARKNNITTGTFGLKSKENIENVMTSAVLAGTVSTSMANLSSLPLAHWQMPFLSLCLFLSVHMIPFD